MRSVLLPLLFLLAVVSTAGCSTWRCRGFVNSQSVPVERPKGDYYVGSLVFEGLRDINSDDAGKFERLMWLSQQSHLTQRSYEEDISRAMGYTNVSESAQSIQVHVLPCVESSEGWKTVFWPLTCTLGVMPAHFSSDLPFMVQVKFPDESVRRKPKEALVRIDMQRGLTPYDMDNPPPALGSAAEYRDDGTIGSGSELRDERLRDVFIKVIANVVLMEIADREGAKTREMGPQRTEFGRIYYSTVPSHVSAQAEFKPQPQPEPQNVDNPTSLLSGNPAEPIKDDPSKLALSDNDDKVNDRKTEKPVAEEPPVKKLDVRQPSSEYVEKERKLRSLLQSGFLSQEEYEAELKKFKENEECK